MLEMSLTEVDELCKMCFFFRYFIMEELVATAVVAIWIRVELFKMETMLEDFHELKNGPEKTAYKRLGSVLC